MARGLGTIGIVDPRAHLHGGNRVTALRWACIFRRLGCKVFREQTWSGRPCDVLVVLNARRSHASVERARRERPDLPVVVAATGTDIYGDGPIPRETRESFSLAARIVVLQPHAVEQLPEDARSRARLIYQSVSRPKVRPSRAEDVFEVCTIAHLRPVKDPLLPARAARLLPASSRIRIVHLGGLIDETMGGDLERELRENPRFGWLGDRPRSVALEVLARSRAFVSSSRHEGGSNAISEALACGVPVLATAIPGSLGLLGDDYPGAFAVGDARALSGLLHRAETDAGFLRSLEERCRARAGITDPEREIASWRELLAELRPVG